MAWSSSWGLTDLVSSVGETLKQYESVVDSAMGVPASGISHSSLQKATPKREEAEPASEAMLGEAFAADVDASMLAPRTPSPPPVQPTPPLPTASQNSNGASAIKSPAPTRPAKDEFSLEDLLGSPFSSSKASAATTVTAAPAATPAFADPLRLFGLISSNQSPVSTSAPSPPVFSSPAPKDAPESTPQQQAHTQAAPSLIVHTTPILSPYPRAISPSPTLFMLAPAPSRPTPDTPAYEPLVSFDDPLPILQTPPTPADVAIIPVALPTAVQPVPVASPAPLTDEHIKAGAASNDEVKRLREALTQRERQLETLNAAGAALQDTNTSLLAELERERERLRHTDLDRISSEYGGRITDLERRLASVTKERDQSRRDRDEQAKGGDTSAEELLRARSEVTQLRSEGEALSRRQLALEDAAKKNRKKMKDDEAALAALNERVKSMEQLLETKTERLKIAEENNRKYDESIGSLRSLNESLTKRLEEKTRAAEGAQAQLAETQAALEKTWRELAEQKRLGASAEERTETVSKETESKFREEARSVLAKQERDFAAKEADLHQAMLELRATIARNLERAAWREDELRKEVGDLQQRLQEAQARTQELNALNAESTRPLLRQIDSLQQSHLAKQQIWDQLETSLTERVHEAEERAQLAVDKERAAVAALNDVSIRVRSLESQLSSERGSSARLAAELDLVRSSSDEQIKTIQNKLGQAEVQQREAESALRDARSREARLQQEMRDSTAKSEVRAQALEKKLAEFATSAPLVTSTSTTGREPSGVLSPSPSTNSLNATPHRRPSETSLVALGSNYGGGLAPALEKMQAMHTQREGEITSLQEQLNRVERERSALAEELVSLTTKVSQIQAELAGANAVRAELSSLKQRHTTALELLGEKEEKLEELKADLMDMKQMYRSQITEMVEKNAQLTQEVTALKQTPR